MSLFGSLYDDAPDGDAGGSAPDHAPEGVAEVAQADALTGVPTEEVQEDTPTDAPIDVPRDDEDVAPAVELEIDAPDMSLHDFAAQMFSGESDETDETDVPADETSAAGATAASGASADAGDAPIEIEIDVPAEPSDPDPIDDTPLDHVDENVDGSEAAGGGGVSAGFSSLFTDDTADSGPAPPTEEPAPAPTEEPTPAAAPIDHDATPDVPGSAPVEPATTPAAAGSFASAASDLADLAKGSVATLAPPEADDDTDNDTEANDSASEATPRQADDAPTDFGEPLLIDDLLPSSTPSRGPSLPAMPSGVPVKLVVVLLVAAVIGFFGMRALAGGSEASSDAGGATAPAPAEAPGVATSPGDVVEQAQLAGAEVELRNATIAAQAEYATAGTLALPASDWAALIPEMNVVDGNTGTLAEGTLLVVSDEDTACFETLLADGTTVAAGVTVTSVGFVTDPGGASICSTDAGVIDGWAPSLSGA